MSANPKIPPPAWPANLPDGTYIITIRAIGFEPRVVAGQRPGAVVNAALSAAAPTSRKTTSW
mgnify:CR=1 FL=1